MLGYSQHLWHLQSKVFDSWIFLQRKPLLGVWSRERVIALLILVRGSSFCALLQNLQVGYKS